MSNNYFTITEFRELHTPSGYDAMISLIHEIKNDAEENEKFYVKENDQIRPIKYSWETDTLYLGDPIPTGTNV